MGAEITKSADEREKYAEEEKARKQVEEIRKNAEEEARKQVEELMKNAEEKARKKVEELRKYAEEKARKTADEREKQVEEELMEFADEREKYADEKAGSSVDPADGDKNLAVEISSRSTNLVEVRLPASVASADGAYGNYRTINTEKREDKEFLILSDANFLPRYKYHRSLLDWFVEGLPQALTPQLKSKFQDCSIIIGGRLNDKDKENLFGDATTVKKEPFINIHTEPATRMFKGLPEVLIVYFFTEDTSDLFQLISMVELYFLPGKISLLFVIAMDNMDEQKIKSTFDLLLYSIVDVDFVSKCKEEIITKITCMLEQRLVTFFEQAHKTLQIYSKSSNVRTNLLEVKAVLKRLGQALGYSRPFTNDVVEEDTEHNEMEKILQRFADQIHYRRYDGNTLYVIVCSDTVRENIIYYFSELKIQNTRYDITVKNRLSISELSNPGVPLHGAKFVYENEDVDAFYADYAFATAGCLMMANNNNTMVAVTCRHAVENVETCYTLIEDSVVKLGQKQQSENPVKFLHDDIAVIVVDNETHFLVNEKCEKLLLDTSDLPTPAQILLSTLEKGDIVHKRGANTGLTTGVVNDVKFEKIGNCFFPSYVIYIIGRDGKPFADKGDSGSLVFQHSMSPIRNVLDVCAMVNGKIDIPIQNPDVICFPFSEGCESLRKNVPNVQNITFFNV